MARRKSARKIPKKQPIRKSIVQASKLPAERLPSELIHMVFTYLEPTEAAAFRLVGRVVAEIGLQYLVPTAYLALNEESYDRLLAIAEHPVVSKYVVRLEYESEGLTLVDRDQWCNMWRNFDRKSVRQIPLLNTRQTSKAFDRAWLMYEKYHASQERGQQAQCFPQKIAEAMKQLPNLRTIFASAHRAYWRYSAEIRGLLPTYHLLRYHPLGRSSIADTTSSILSAAESVDLRCQHFLSQSINLQIFGQINNNLAFLKKSMLHLKTMNLNFMLLQRGREEADILVKGCMLDFVTSAPNLQHLSLDFTMMNYSHADIPFDQIIGGFYWPSLKAVSLVSLCLHEYELWHFFGRHARTLKHVSLEDMRLSEGSWPRTFQEMRRIFAFGQQLNTCRLSGFFSRPADCQMYIMGTVVSDYVQATDLEDISLNEYCEKMGVSSMEIS